MESEEDGVRMLLLHVHVWPSCQKTHKQKRDRELETNQRRRGGTSARKVKAIEGKKEEEEKM